jgi:hypothetical protein
MTDEFADEFKNGLSKFVDFKGIIRVIGLDPNVDPCPPEIITVPFNSSGGGYNGGGEGDGGGSTSGGSGSSGGGGLC